MSCYIIAEAGAENTRSPKVWNHVFQRLNWEKRMIPLNIKREFFLNDLEKMFRNPDFECTLITNPHKEQIFSANFSIDIDEISRSIGAINLIYKRGSKFCGINTDRIGAIESIKENFLDYKNKKIIILGFGGAAKAVYYGLINEGCDVVVATREPKFLKVEKYENIKNLMFNDDGCLLINATGVSFLELSTSYENLKAFVSNRTQVFDLRYKDNTVDYDLFLRNHIKYIDGLRMNIVQAAVAFSKVFEGKIKLTENQIHELMSEY